MKPIILTLLCCSLLVASEIEDQILDAARNGDLAGVKTALEKGAPVEAKTRYGVTPLFYAASNGHLEVVRFLLDKGAEVNVKDSFYGFTALARAVSKGNADVVKLMIERGAKDADAALSATVFNDKPEVAKAILATGKASEGGKKQAMQLAAQQKKDAVLEVFKAAGITPPDPVKYIDIDAAELAKFAGKYRDERQNDFVLAVKDGSLNITPPAGPPGVLKAVDATTFHLANVAGITLKMQVENGKVIGAVVNQMGNIMTMRKVE